MEETTTSTPPPPPPPAPTVSSHHVHWQTMPVAVREVATGPEPAELEKRLEDVEAKDEPPKVERADIAEPWIPLESPDYGSDDEGEEEEHPDGTKRKKPKMRKRDKLAHLFGVRTPDEKEIERAIHEEDKRSRKSKKEHQLARMPGRGDGDGTDS
ncbi:hypothetical protein T439DRAFT_329290, partial [Meredithblackwellia eburnea MCA 4105]